MTPEYTRAEWDAYCDWLRQRTTDRAGFESNVFTLVKVAGGWMHDNGHRGVQLTMRKVIALSRSAGYEVKSAGGARRRVVVGLALRPR
ncbi:hypothetical protein [Streptomyces sp. NPDC058451]|uniref:hypothetical protein n=1 Tax=Streptomyces sp. NPDC058451 TaxID=3346506 RepID=UPI0036681B02